MKMPLMKCGHTAQAINSRTKKPCCLICLDDPDSKIVDSKLPDLTNRKARCTYYGKTKPNRRYANDECNYGCEGNPACQCGDILSNINLAFFEYRGIGSKYAENQCHICGFHTKNSQLKNGKVCYNNSDKPIPEVCINKGKPCIYGEYEYDRFYCGCHGWD